MRKGWVLFILTALTAAAASFSTEGLRSQYSRPSRQWPRPWIDSGLSWAELDTLPPGPLQGKEDKLAPLINLGKALFFDPRLSGSGKISCATCHQPEKHWTDGATVSTGHAGARTRRHAPTIQNAWFYHRQFWDGRARDLQDQAFGPINSETEMNSDMGDVITKLRRSKGYRGLFREAFGDEGIDPDRLTEAIAVFEQSVRSAPSRFDNFLRGDRRALSRAELRGLHLFRTKARCINCHHGPFFSDNRFHNSGLLPAGQPWKDRGREEVTREETDRGRFKTPSLRDAALTGPWMHDGSMLSLATIIDHYNAGAPLAGLRDPLIKPLNLSAREKADLLAFLQAISAPPPAFQPPVLPD